MGTCSSIPKLYLPNTSQHKAFVMEFLSRLPDCNYLSLSLGKNFEDSLNELNDKGILHAEIRPERMMVSLDGERTVFIAVQLSSFNFIPTSSEATRKRLTSLLICIVVFPDDFSDHK